VLAGQKGLGGAGGTVMYKLPDGAGGSITRDNYGLGGPGGAGGPGGLRGLGPGQHGATGRPGAAGFHGAHGTIATQGAAGNPGKVGTASGGGIFVSGGSISLNHVTVANNGSPNSPGSSSRAGGGVYQSGTGAVAAMSCIFGGNRAATGPDYAGSVTASDSIFQTAPSGTLSGSGNMQGVNPGLNSAGLEPNGGPTRTISLANTSPAIGAAGNPQGLFTDQRGYTLPGGAHLDIGAFQTRASAELSSPTAPLTATNVTTSNANSLNPYTFTIVYKDNVAVSQASLAGAQVVVQAPGGGLPSAASISSITPSGTIDRFHDATIQTVVYQFTPAAGSWSANPDGTYTIEFVGPKPLNVAGNPVASSIVGTFTVAASGSHLFITAEPVGSVTVGVAFPLTVALEDAAGNTLKGYNGILSVTLSGTPGGTLGGTLTAQASDGMATFSDLTVSQAGSGYKLVVSGTGLASVSSDAFSATGGPPPPPPPPPPAAVPGPTLAANPQIIKHNGKLTAIILRFSEPMNAGSVENKNNIILMDAGIDHIFANKNDRKIAIKSAAYRSSDNSVTLVLKRPDSLKNSIRLTVNAQPPSGVAAADGQFLNSSASGAPGSNAVIYFGAKDRLPKPSSKPKKPKAVSSQSAENGGKGPSGRTIIGVRPLHTAARSLAMGGRHARAWFAREVPGK
jgi:hypothetical protein